MAYKYLDQLGLSTLWDRIKSYISSLGYTTNKGTVGGSGTSGYLAKWTGTTAVGNGPQLGNSTATFLRNDGNWAEPPGTITKIQKNGSDLTILNKTVNINVPTSASQLTNDEEYISAKQSEDNTPYIYRATGGSLEVDNRESVETIVGGTVAWNQLANTTSYTNNQTDSRTYISLRIQSRADGSVFQTLPNVTTTGVYEVIFSSSITTSTGFHLKHSGSQQDFIFVNNTNDDIISGHKYRVMMKVDSLTLSTAGGLVISVIGINDLTLALNPTLADYVYSLEQGTAGAGIAWLKQYDLIDDQYHAYSQGSLESVNVSAHVMTGKNLLNDSFSAYDASSNYAYINNIMPKGSQARFTFTDKDTSVDVSGCYIGFAYDDLSQTNVLTQYRWVLNNGTIQSNVSNVSIVDNTTLCGNVMVYPKTEAAFNKIFARYNVMVELGSTATTYEPYWSETYPIDSSVTLRGMLKKDASNNLYYDGDTYESDGTVNRKYAEVDLGSVNWDYYSSYNTFVAVISEIYEIDSSDYARGIICAKYPSNNNWWTSENKPDKTISHSGGYSVAIKDSSYSDPAVFKTAMSGVMLCCEKKTPTTESADPYTNPQVCDPDGTEEWVDYGVSQGTRDYAVPVGHETKYFTIPEIFQYLQNPEYLLTNQIKPMQSKTFTNVIGTIDDWANTTFFFGKIQPTNYYANWHIKYNIYAEAAGRDDAKTTCEVGIYGNQSAYSSYYSWNQIQNGSYRPIYYHVFYRATSAGITSNYGHALGVRLQSSWHPITAENSRTIIIDIIECENCTFTFFDNMTLYANIPGSGSTNYAGYTEFDAASQGLQEAGDANTITQNRVGYSSIKAAENIYRYQILLSSKDRKTVIPVSNANNTFTIGKTYSTLPFDPFGQIYWYSTTTTVATNGNVPNDTLYRQYMPDLRYAFDLNATATYKLTARQPFYLTATPQFDGTAVITKPTGSVIGPLSTTLPSTQDGLIYIYLGRAYEDTYPYRGQLSLQHPVYWYKDGEVRLFTADDAYGYSKNYWVYNSTNETIELVFPE